MWKKTMTDKGVEIGTKQDTLAKSVIAKYTSYWLDEISNFDNVGY